MMQETPNLGLESDPSVAFGKLLAHPEPGEEIVISGMSGKFPLADNVDEFKEKLYNKVDMVTKVPRVHPEMPAGFGFLKDRTRFDTGFFGIHQRHARTLNVLGKITLEKCYECILDAGLNPSDIEGTNTGLFLSYCFSEYEHYFYFKEHVKEGNTILGNQKSAIADAVSSQLKLKGPSIVLDTACSTGGFALDNAVKAIRMGQCNAAIVASANCLLAASVSLQFARLGVLSLVGECRPFDENARGYVRSEASVAFLLQKAKNCNRIYARVLHAKTNCDGFKQQGITYPNGAAQLTLLKEIYYESTVAPTEVSYIEAHGTGTIVGDPEEISSIDEFFSPNRKSPLLVGSVKSSIGHSEPTSLLCGMVKVILAFESNLISPNINYQRPRKNLKGIVNGQLKVVTENTRFPDQNPVAGVSSFGFGGGNAHVILKQNTKPKINNGKPMDDLPRLVCVSGRTDQAVSVLLDDIASKFDVEQMALIYNAFRKPIKNQLYRGYVIATGEGVIQKSVRPCTDRKNLILHFGALCRSPENLLRQILSLTVLVPFKERISQFMQKKTLNIDAIVKSSKFFTDYLTQLALVELLKKLEVSYETLLAHSVGKFFAAYFQNSLTLEQVLDCAFVFVGYLENGTKSLTSYRFKRDTLETQKSTILSDFELILQTIKLTNGHSNVHHKTPLPEELYKALFESLDMVVGKLKKQTLVITVGETITQPKAKKENYLNLTSASDLVTFMKMLGSLYEYGQDLNLQILYPKVSFPVSRNTPMIAPVIKWKHDKTHFIPSYEYTEVEVSAKTVNINLLDEDWASLGGHVIDGRILFPATSYLFLVWTLLADHIGVNFEQMKVTFEDCKFLRACQLSRTNALRLDVMIHKVSGCFEISENCAPVMTGIIKVDHSQRSTKTSNGIVNDFDDEDCLNRKDIYKELRLRGYNYKGKFKSVLKSNQKATLGIIEWLDDWVAFMDNMLQMMILGADTRLLYVPTGIEKVVIDPEEHLKKISQFQNNQEEAESKPPVNMLVNVDYSSNIVKSGGIEFTGLKTSSISRKKTTALPVLEKYSFVPNSGKLSIESAVRVFMQIALENNCGFKITAVELVDEASKDDAPLIGPIIIDVLGDQPLVHADVKILSNRELDCDLLVENTNLKDVTDATVVVGDDLLFRNSVLAGALGTLKNQGYLISREKLSMDVNRVDLNNLDLLNVYETDKEKIMLFRKKSDELHKERAFVNVTSSAPNFEWLKALKAEVLKKARDVVVWCQGEPLNGLIGLVNCIRREPDCQHVRGLFIVGNGPPFDPSSSFYQNHLDRGLGMNVLMNGIWGTYRHILLDDIKEVKREHCYADTSIRGDLSSIKWFEGPLCKNTVYSSDLVEVYYSPLNFKDVMTASGKINVDVSTKDRREQQCVQGFEFSGKTLSGKRVMGMLPQGTLATLVKVDPPMLWNVPDSWTLKEAASVPVVYSTCIYALTVIGRIRRGDSILIHSGTGGIGQAAINLCLSMGCTIFVTVGTEEKRNFIRKNFPQINEKCIGNSRDLSFERMVMKQTKGKGVDLVLNSLAEEKLLVSVRCLSRNGRFLEIGKFDMASDNKLKLHALKQGGSYHGAMLDKLFKEPDEAKRKLNVLVQKYIDSGAIKPLSTTVFNKTEIEQAFRFMTTGRHMGKVMVEIRNEDDIIHPLTFKGYPRYFCDPTKTYIICGGLGGFGLELADWLVLRGCQNLVLTSRKGVTTGYQKYRIKIWRSYGCTVKISTKDITTKQGCQALIEESNELGPVRAIFNLAVVLKDAILANQTEESFQTSFKPKAHATQYLDEITRISCPDLRDFVVFSSVSCGRGNAGQTNYGMSNSVMERICERRRSEGYPALAIQWGAIGDVGLVADLQEDQIEIEIGGTLQQSIASCLTVLDVLLRQTEVSIVSSMVVAEKKSTNSSHSIMEVVAGVLGIRDLKSVSIHSTLAELGMDSMSTVEVKQTLEREYNIILSPNEIRGLTLARVKDIHEEEVIDSNNSQEGPIDWAIVLKALLESDEQTSRCITLKTHNSKSTSNLPKVIVFPGIEGVCVLLEKITENLEVQAFGVNYLSKFQEDCFPKMAEKLLPAILKLLKPKEPFNILAHSMGTVVALEVASLLEKLGHQGKIVLIDGSPFLMKMLEGVTSVRNRENFALENALRVRLNEEETRKIMEDICKCSTLKEKLNIMISNFKVTEGVTESFISNSITAILKRLQACDYTPTLDKLKSKAWLYKPTLTTLKLDSEDYELGQYFEHPVDVKVFDGNHTSILENKDMAQDIMRQILESGNSNK